MIGKPLNGTQRDFNRLCELGGGVRGGPARTKVQELLRTSGQALNGFARQQIADSFAGLADANPWHVCFAVGMCWGHRAWWDTDFVAAAARLLAAWNDADLRTARSFPYERGPEPIEDSLRGAHRLFEVVRLPDRLPTDLARHNRAQERWLSRIISPDRARYIGSWNATAMSMVAVCSDPVVSAALVSPQVLLPPGGPIYGGLSILHAAGVIAQPPSGTELDDSAFEAGALYENNARLEDVLRGLPGWNLIDVHSGVYMLGTRLAESDSWL